MERSKFTHYTLFSRLKNVTRFSGDIFLQSESLESHILEMVGLAFDLHFNVGKFDLDKLIYLILVHDLDESVTVDIPRPFKYFSDEFREVFNRTVRDYMGTLGLDKEFLSDCLTAKSKGLEGKLVHLIDIFQVRLKLELEISLGNSTLNGHIENVSSYIEELKSDEELKEYLNYLLR